MYTATAELTIFEPFDRILWELHKHIPSVSESNYTESSFDLGLNVKVTCAVYATIPYFTSAQCNTRLSVNAIFSCWIQQHCAAASGCQPISSHDYSSHFCIFTWFQMVKL